MAYYKIRMKDKDTYKPYHAYVSAYDKTEARQAVRCELLNDEKDDVIDGITEITEQEYIEGYAEFGDGIRR